MPRYRKKPVVVEAVQWDGSEESTQQINNWAGSTIIERDGGDWVLWVGANSSWVDITPHEWVIKDSAGFYPCLPDVFVATYDPAE